MQNSGRGRAGRPWYTLAPRVPNPPSSDPHERGNPSASAAGGARRPTSIAHDRTPSTSRLGTMSGVALRRLDGQSSQEIDRAVDFMLRVTDDDRAIESLSAGKEVAADVLFRRSLEEALRNGGCDLAYVDGELAGISVWQAPGSDYRFHDDPTLLRLVEDEISDWYAVHYDPRWEELYTSGIAEGSIARRDAWKLLWLFVVPEYQSRGVKRALLDVLAQKADRDRRRVLTEVRSPDTVSRFLRCGYRYCSVKNFACAKFVGFPVWLLIRDPLPPQSASVKPEKD